MGLIAEASEDAMGFPAGINNKNQKIKDIVVPMIQTIAPRLGCFILKNGQYIVPTTHSRYSFNFNRVCNKFSYMVDFF